MRSAPAPRAKGRASLRASRSRWRGPGPGGPRRRARPSWQPGVGQAPASNPDAAALANGAGVGASHGAALRAVSVGSAALLAALQLVDEKPIAGAIDRIDAPAEPSATPGEGAGPVTDRAPGSVGAMAAQQVGDSRLAAALRDVEGGPEAAVAGIDAGAPLEQLACGVEAPVGRGLHERGPAGWPGGIRIGSGAEQQANALGAVGAGGTHQRREAIGVAGLDSGAGPDRPSNSRDVARTGRGEQLA